MFGRTLWKGPRICSPAYDLKLRLTKCVIIRRGAPGSLVIAGGGGGGMLPRISSKLRLSTTASVAQRKKKRRRKKHNFNSSVRVVSGGVGGVLRGGGVEEHIHTHKTKQTDTRQTTTPEKVDRHSVSLFWKTRGNWKRPWPLKKTRYSTNALHNTRL